MSDFDKYIKQGEPGQAEKARIWQTAIGLQDVDGLKTSEYLKETAQRHIEGDISIEDVRDLLDSYYESKTKRERVEERTEEADKVSAAITSILSENTFTFSPASTHLQDKSAITISASKNGRGEAYCRFHFRGLADSCFRRG